MCMSIEFVVLVLKQKNAHVSFPAGMVFLCICQEMKIMSEMTFIRYAARPSKLQKNNCVCVCDAKVISVCVCICNVLGANKTNEKNQE